MTERIETQRQIEAPAATIFALLCDPQGHVAIDSSGTTCVTPLRDALTFSGVATPENVRDTR